MVQLNVDVESDVKMSDLSYNICSLLSVHKQTPNASCIETHFIKALWLVDSGCQLGTIYIYKALKLMFQKMCKILYYPSY